MHWTVPSVDSAQFVAAPEWMGVVWFLLLGVLLAVYAMLDGFDLGVGIVHFAVARGAPERAAQIGAIGPVWDGNEVWLVVFGGALFAAFPLAYAAIFSAFYLPFVVLLFCLIARAASIEMRHVFHSPGWRFVCDAGFALSSFTAAVLFGVAVGACMQGLPLGPNGEFAPNLPVAPGAPAVAPGPVQSVAVLLTPFSLSVGLLSVALCAVHGCAFLGLRTAGAHAERCRRVALIAWGAFFVLVLAVTALAIGRVPAAMRNFGEAPWLFVVAALGAVATLWALRCILRRNVRRAFAATCLMAVALVALFMAALFPDMVIDRAGGTHSVSILTASSSRFTLLLMFFVVLVAVPLVAAYTLITYATFNRTTGDVYAQGGHS